jgi:hypothetical protein
VIGNSTLQTPSGRRQSSTAFAMAAGVPTVAASPTPFTPSIAGARRLGPIELQVRDRIRAGHCVIEQTAGDQLPIWRVDNLLEERFAHALGRAAGQLALHQQRVYCSPTIIDQNQPLERNAR